MEAGTLLGPVPEWLTLGPVVEINGLKAREVLGDWSHRHAVDRPPRYIIDGVGPVTHLSGFDRSESRPPVIQNRPGKYIGDLKGRHSGAVAILFNGESMGQHDLHRIKVPMIGMNRTHVGYAGYAGPQPDYLCIVDWAWFDKPKWRESVLTHPCIINGSDHKEDIGYRVVRHPRMAPFSFDLARDGYVGPIPATTGHLALQLAVYLGFTKLYCLGWDMGGGHFDGTKGSLWIADALRYHRRQASLITGAGVEVFICGSPNSAVDFYPHVPFEVIC